jgi:hypothetical protein
MRWGIDDDAADWFSGERGGQVPGFEPIEELDFAKVPCAEHKLELTVQRTAGQLRC